MEDGKSVALHSAFPLTFLFPILFRMNRIVLSSMEGIQQRAQIQFPNHLVWDILWDSYENRIIVYQDTRNFFEVQGSTLKDAMRAIGYHAGAYEIQVDNFHVDISSNLDLNETIHILQLPVAAPFLLQMRLKMRDD